MHHFQYRNGTLHAEDVDLHTLAAAVGTPFYCYSRATLERHYAVLETALADLPHLICYAVKANSNQAVLRVFARLGSGMDVVSIGELKRALAAGVPPDRIIFAGVGKTREEMAFAIDKQIKGFNVESEPELNTLAQVARECGSSAKVALRVNPDVDARTHAKISTGKAENKFGIPFGEAHRLAELTKSLDGVELVGLHMHIGSQITELSPFGNAFALMRELVEDLRSNGHALQHIDLGGGLGAPYSSDKPPPPPPADYAALLRETLGNLGLQLIVEPGRVLTANAGILVTRLIYAKYGKTHRFSIIDAAMNDLLRPTLYEAHHDVWPVDEDRRSEPTVRQDIVGPVCETGDYLARDRDLPAFKSGDLLAVMSAGAYGAVMASTYNTRPLIPEVMVNGSQWALVRPRVDVADLIALDKIPDWLA